MPEPTAISPASHPAPHDAGDELEHPSLEELAALLPQYEMHAVVGVGGMGAVYRARQLSLDRWVAIKVLPASSAQRAEDVERFIKEARAMARLVHPHIVAVFDFGQTSAGHLYLVMEFIEGTDLHRLTRAGGVTAENAPRIVSELCAALQFAHDRGVAHRDIKPANILITTDGRVKVADFGLAKEASAHTVADEVEYGTPDYTAPERLIIGATVDHRADIFSLGVVMHEMLTGKTPAAAGEQACQGLPAGFRQVIEKCIQEEPEARYQKASEVRAALFAALSHPGGAAQVAEERPAVTADFLPRQPVQRAQVRPPQIHEEPPELYTRYRPPLLAGLMRRLSTFGWGLACLALVAAFAWILLKDRIRIEMPGTLSAGEEAALATPTPLPAPPAAEPVNSSPKPASTPGPSPVAGAVPPAAQAVPAAAPAAGPPAQVVRRASVAAPFSLEGPSGEVARLRGHSGQAAAVRLLDGGSRAVSVGTDGTLRLWDLAARKSTGVLEAGIGQIVRLQVTPDEKKALIFGFAEDRLALADLDGPRLLHSAPFPNDRLIAAVYLPGQGQVVAGGATEDGVDNLYTWSPGAEAGFQPLKGFTGRVYAMTLMPDVRGVLVASSELADPGRRLYHPALTVVDGATRAMKSLPPGQLGYITRFLGAPGTTTTFVLGGRPRLLRLPTLEVLASLPPVLQGQAAPLAGQGVDGGRLLLTGWSDGTLRLHECATAEEVWRWQTTQAVTDIAIGPGERWAVLSTGGLDPAASAPGDGDLLLWRLPEWDGMMGKAALQAQVRAQMADLDRHDAELSTLLKRLLQAAPPPDRAQHDQKRALLDSQYLAALRRDLPTAALRDQPAFRAEMERVGRHEALPAADPSLIPALRRQRATYAGLLDNLQRQHAEAAAASRQAAEDALTPLASRRERGGDLLGAARVKSALEDWRARLAQ